MKRKEPKQHPFKPEELPTGKYYGALPDRIIIKGEHWQCITTAVMDGVTYDKLKNTVTGEIRKVERKKFINFLSKLV